MLLFTSECEQIPTELVNAAYPVCVAFVYVSCVRVLLARACSVGVSLSVLRVVSVSLCRCSVLTKLVFIAEHM